MRLHVAISPHCADIRISRLINVKTSDDYNHVYLPVTLVIMTGGRFMPDVLIIAIIENIWEIIVNIKFIEVL